MPPGTVRKWKFALGSSGPIAKDVWGKLALLKRLRSRPLASVKICDEVVVKELLDRETNIEMKRTRNTK